MKEMIEERIKKYVDDNIPIMVIFYSNIECGGQYSGLCFDSTKDTIEITDDYVWVCSDESETFMKWENIICAYIKIL